MFLRITILKQFVGSLLLTVKYNMVNSLLSCHNFMYYRYLVFIYGRLMCCDSCHLSNVKTYKNRLFFFCRPINDLDRQLSLIL